MATFDKIIVNGTIVDGTRAPRFRGSLGIKDGVITEITRGELDAGDADEVLDAKGLVVAPGFVDLHTHYDAQIQWDPYATLSGWHGVTSLVLGNCGFGFAPVAPENRDRAMLSMSRVEAIPFESMKAGMLWDWITFPEWLDTLERIPKGVNVLSYVPVGPLMIWVMGLEAAKTRSATEAEVKEMCRLLELSLDAGGCGWSVQRLGDGFMSLQRDYDGTPMVTDCMDDDLCLAFAEVLKKRGSNGHIQITQASDDIRGDMKFVEKLAEVSGCPVLYNAILANEYYPKQHRRLVDWVNQCQDRGNQVWGQLLTTGNDFSFTFEDFNLLDGQDCWREVTLGTIEEKMAKMQLPKNREALRDDYDNGRMPIATGPIKEFIILEAMNPANKKYEGKRIHELEAISGKHPIDTLLDMVVEENLKTVIFTPAFNTDPGYNKELLDSEYTVPGVSDGGAHTKFVTLGSYTTDFISDFTRDQENCSLEEAHYRLSALPSRMAGFNDRGIIGEGKPADLVIYDFENLRSTESEIVHDFPANEWRRIRKADGYRWIMVNGEVTFEEGDCTGNTPGRLLRNGNG